jgi:multiple sugar transport system permease protein
MSILLSVKAQSTGKNITTYYQKQRWGNRWSFLLLSAPALVWYLAVMGWPLVNMFYMSLLRWEGLLAPKTFVGLRNYIKLFSDAHFRHALANTTIYLIVAVPGILFTAYAMGFFLAQRHRGYRIFRLICFAPAMLSAAVMAMMFTGIYMPDGLLNGLLQSLGLGSLTRIWLADPQTALPAIIALDFWGGLGYNAVLFFAALTNVPQELYEAARLDGAHPWTVMWKIAFPLTLDFFGIVAILQLLYSLLWTAQTVYLLTKGGPGDSSMILSYYLFYNGIAPSQHLGYSQAIGVVLFAFGLVAMLVIRLLTRRKY